MVVFTLLRNVILSLDTGPKLFPSENTDEILRQNLHFSLLLGCKPTPAMPQGK